MNQKLVNAVSIVSAKMTLRVMFDLEMKTNFESGRYSTITREFFEGLDVEFCDMLKKEGIQFPEYDPKLIIRKFESGEEVEEKRMIKGGNITQSEEEELWNVIFEFFSALPSILNWKF